MGPVLQLELLVLGAEGARPIGRGMVLQGDDTNLLVENEGISDNKIIYYPALLVSLFIIGSILIKTYKYLDELEGKM